MDTLLPADVRATPGRVSLFSRIPILGLAVALGILIALLVIPTTRWLVWSQSGLNVTATRSMVSTLREMGFRDIPEDFQREDPHRLTAIADQVAPEDFQVQLAAAEARYMASRQSSVVSPFVQSPGLSMGDEIRSLASRFPNNPSLYANVIRLDTQSRIHIDRPLDEEIISPSSGRSSAPGPAPVPLKYVEPFLKDCEAGERLEPDNAYFPVLRASGLFILKRDDEALAEIHKAAGLARWDPHYLDEADGRWKLTALAGGDQGAMHRLAIQASVLFPEFGAIRSVARVAIAKAIQAELAGRRAEGLRIRMDVARCGALLRAEAPSLIGTMTGFSLTRMIVARPGGEPAPKKQRGRFTIAQNAARFSQYLQSIGAVRENKWYSNEVNLGAAAQAAGMSGINNSPAGLVASRRLTLLWLSDIALIGNAFWFLILGVSGALYVRRWKARRAAGWEREDAFVVLMGGACILLGAGVLAWSQSQMVYTYAMSAAEMVAISSGNMGSLPSDPNIVRGLCAVALVLAPALIAAIALLAAWVRRRPILYDMARSFRVVGMTGAGLLMIGYAVLVTQTARRESEMQTAITGMLQHEGRFLARSVGATWPALKHD